MRKKKINENLNSVHEKLAYIGFGLEKIPTFLEEFKPLQYRVTKAYHETTYQIYRYVPVKDIQILLTPTERLEDLQQRYKLASPIYTYMKPEKQEDIEKYAMFLKMVNDMQMEKIEEIGEEQEKLKNQIPFGIKYENHYKWQVYYSDVSNQYFMLVPTQENDNSAMFYLLKKQIEVQKSKSKKISYLFLPISNEEYSGKYLKKSEIEELENYLWYFTKNWASAYEVYDENNKMSLQIVGDTNVYEKMKSQYRMSFTSKEGAQEIYKMLKALFILASELPEYYQFQAKINQEGSLDFYFNEEKITYDTLSAFLREQAKQKMQENTKLKREVKEIQNRVEKMKQISEEQNEEYLAKERQIVMFLECKKTFLGKIKYFFKAKKVKQGGLVTFQKREKYTENKMQKEAEENIQFEETKIYTIEDLIYICKKLEITMVAYKNAKMDNKALDTKIENLQRKIDNATLYIQEIENHKKSIFDFWKFTNKDELPSLQEGEEEQQKDKEKLKKFFDYEDDIELLAKKVDEIQRRVLSSQELDAILVARKLAEEISLSQKGKLTKEEKNKIGKALEYLKEIYQQESENIDTKDFDIFGAVVQDKTKIKTLNNQKHREIQKDILQILNIHTETEIEDFIDTIKKYGELLKVAYGKIQNPYEISAYYASKNKIETDRFIVFDLNPEHTLKKLEELDGQEVNLYRVNIPEKEQLLFYTNRVFYDNKNQTLPLGMDVSQEVLLDLTQYQLELKEKKQFCMNVPKDEFHVSIQSVKVYEYDLTKNEKQENKEE